MENFLKQFTENNINLSLGKISENVDQNDKSNAIKLIQKVIFKNDVVVDLKATLSRACSLDNFTVTNKSVKKIVRNLHGVLSQKVDDEIKVNVFCCTFESFAACCRDEDVAVVQFLVVLCHILGFKIEKTSDSGDGDVVVNETNFQNVFAVNTSKPLPICFQILNNLLISLSKLPVNLNSSDMQRYYKWLQQLIRILASLQPFQCIFMDIFSACCEIEIKLLESNLDIIFPRILAQDFTKKSFCVSYEAFLINNLKTFGKFQRTLKFVSKFLSNIKITQTDLTQEIILPSEFCVEFSKIVSTASSQQSLQLMEILVQYVDECFQVMVEGESGAKVLVLGVTSELLVAFLKEVKIFASSISSSTVQSFIDKVNGLEVVMRNFGQFLFSDKKFIVENEPIVYSFLRLCHYTGEIQILVDCYKDFPLSESGAVSDQDWHCCLSLKQWNSLVKIVLKSKLRSCNPICFQLALQRLRTQKLKKETCVEDATVKLLLAQFDDDRNLDAHQLVSAEDMTMLIDVLTIKQSKSVVRRIFKEILQEGEKGKVASWLTDWRLQENYTFNVILFSELLKETGNVLSSAVDEKMFSKIDWLLEEFFDDGNIVDVDAMEKLPEKLNHLFLKGRKLRKSIKNSDISRLVKLFKCLPLGHMNKDLRRLGLSFAVALAVISSGDDATVSLLLENIFGFLRSDVDASTCFHIGYCIKWLSELDNPTDNCRLKIIEGLVRSSPNSKFGLGQISEVVDAPELFKYVAPLRVLETQVVVYQELGKCWLRAKKRKSDNDLIGGYRTKLAKVITEEVKEMDEKGIHTENYKVLFKIAGMELKKTVTANDENQISNFMQLKFPTYFDFALNNLKRGFDEASVLFLNNLLQSVSATRSLIPDNCIKEIWSAVKNYEKFNWRMFASSCPDDDFDVILSDLLDMTKTFLSSPSESCNYFGIWAPFIEGSSGSKKNACQQKLQELFNFIQDCQLLLVDAPVRKKIFIAKFFSFCLSHRKVLLTSHMTDTIIHAMVEFRDDSFLPMEQFHSFFIAQIDAGSSILSRRFTYNKNKIHLSYVLFNHLLGWLIRRCVGTHLTTDDVIVLSACAFCLEKWVSLMAKEQKDFARISAYFITTIVSTIASVTVPPAIKIHLTNCLNHFLSISDSHTITYLMRILKPGYQQVFNSVYDQFKKYYKYSGKV